MKKHNTLYAFVDLKFFDGDGAGGAASSGADANNARIGSSSAPAVQTKSDRNPLANVKYGKQLDPSTPTTEPVKDSDVTVTTDTQEARRAEFDRLIKGEYKDLFDERAKKMIDTRFKEVKTLETQANQAKELAPVLELLASKYGVESSNVEKIVQAIKEDDSYYEQEALDKGLTVDQLKKMKALERENAEFKRTAEELKRQQDADRIYQQWQQQSENCRQVYPKFDLAQECSSPESGKRFMDLLKSGIDVRTAYEVVHKDELIGGAMQYTAQVIQQKTVNDIQARGMRPSENGGSGSAAAIITKSDPKNLTKKDREEISRRVMRGERIEF